MTISGTPHTDSVSHYTGEILLTDFTSTSSDLGWYVVNDDVMGGRSEGNFQLEQAELCFAGRTNTNGGGFSSIRTKPLQLDLSNYAGIRLQVRGDGRRYTWRLTTAECLRGRQVSYWANFETRNGTWSTVNLPFSSFIPKYRGNHLDGPALDLGQITGMGLMISDNQDGPFELRLVSVHAYSTDAPSTLMQYQWKNRVLVLNSATEDDEILRQQIDEVALTPEEFGSRSMVLVTLLDNTASTDGDRELTVEEVARVRVALGIRPGSFALRLIGKDGSLKLAGESATPMSEVYALIDSMPMRQKEMRDRL